MGHIAPSRGSSPRRPAAFCPMGYGMAMLFGLLLTLGLSLASPPSEDGRTVRVATYNVWGLPWPLAPSRGERLRRVGRWAEARDVDVVALQEVWGSSGRFVDEGLVPGFELRRPRASTDSGLAVVARGGMKPRTFRVFQARRGPDALKRKGVWWVDVELSEGTTVALGVVHLQAGRGERRSEVRREQLETVLRSLPDGPVVLVGDFNLHRGVEVDARSHTMLEEAGLVELRTAQRVGTSRYGADRLDRVYARGLHDAGVTFVDAQVGPQTDLSDHRPVWVDLHVP